MPANRFYIDERLKGELTLTGTELHHLQVMRARVGDEIELVNGRGSLAEATITDLSKSEAQLEVTSATHSPVSPPRLNLGIPYMRPSKLELVIEKCIELGTDAFYLYRADHSEKKEISEHQKDRLKTIALSSMKQCGRLDLPSIHIISSMKSLTELDIPIFFGDTREKKAQTHPEGKLLFVTGPEKGFSDKELKILDQKGTSMRLGPYILRAETAPIAAVCRFSPH